MGVLSKDGGHRGAKRLSKSSPTLGMNGHDAPPLGAWHAHVQLDTPLGAFMGAPRVALLEAIERHGSIARAAKAVAWGYKAAWEAVDDMNNLAAQPLVVRSSGGARGGGTTLTPYARRLIAFYRALEAEHQAALARVQPWLSASPGSDSAEPQDVAAFQRLLRRWSMQSSARNQFAGRVREVRASGVEAQVQVEIAPGVDVVGVLTQESVQRLRLQPEAEVQVWVKSSSVMLTLDDAARLSARNRLPGTVVRLLRGPVGAEVVLQLDGGGHRQIVAAITDDSVQRLGLHLGQRATAFFKASSVVFAVVG
ncbi:TOBE domain-containing protein [Vitreoscilla filiformis]|nr:TOBE domain-containing protein [Vitreoscilla filiformis]